jgi:hypothetical protein
MPAEVICCKCGGEHALEHLDCSVRTKAEVAKIRAVQRASYLEAVRRVEGASGVEDAMVNKTAPGNVAWQSREPDMLHVKNMGFVTLNARIIKCTAQTKRKSEKMFIIVSAAERFLGLSLQPRHCKKSCQRMFWHHRPLSLCRDVTYIGM